MFSLTHLQYVSWCKHFLEELMLFTWCKCVGFSLQCIWNNVIMKYEIKYMKYQKHRIEPWFQYNSLVSFVSLERE